MGAGLLYQLAADDTGKLKKELIEEGLLEIKYKVGGGIDEDYYCKLTKFVEKRTWEGFRER